MFHIFQDGSIMFHVKFHIFLWPTQMTFETSLKINYKMMTLFIRVVNFSNYLVPRMDQINYGNFLLSIFITYKVTIKQACIHIHSVSKEMQSGKLRFLLGRVQIDELCGAFHFASAVGNKVQKTPLFTVLSQYPEV